MSELDNYIRRASETLRSGDSSAIDALARGIVSAFNAEIPNLSHYRGARIADCGNRHTAVDLRKLIGKLRVLRDRKDQELYGPYGLETVTNHVHLLERAAEDGIEGEDLRAVYETIDSIYVNRYGFYVDGLSGYGYREYELCPQQTELRIEKLKVIRDEEFRKLKIAEARAASVSMVQNASASAKANVQVTVEATFEQIDKLPETTLSDDDKTLLKGMIGDLNTKDKSKRDSKLGKLQSWLADKGTDVFIAAMPYVVQLIKSQFS